MTERERCAALAAFLPDLEAEGFAWERWGRLHPRAAALVQHCDAAGWVRPFDWAAWARTPEAETLRDDPTAMASATPEQLSRLLTTIIRNDRFSRGVLAACFESGLIVRILRRAKQLAEA